MRAPCLSISILLAASWAAAGCRRGAPEAPRNGPPDPALLALEKELQEKGEIVRRRPPGTPPAARLEDEALRRQVALRLSASEDPEVPGLLMEVEASAGQVTISGRVGSALQLARTVDFILAIPGVEGVTARLAIDPDDGQGPVKGASDEPPGSSPR